HLTPNRIHHYGSYQEALRQFLQELDEPAALSQTVSGLSMFAPLMFFHVYLVKDNVWQLSKQVFNSTKSNNNQK
ncbi:hypothetical protein PFISCL1PPCAC_11829, partial [Pristionchus fissidentatus]